MSSTFDESVIYCDICGHELRADGTCTNSFCENYAYEEDNWK